jgi:hypothetical protein
MDIERSKPKQPSPAKQKDLDPPKQVTVNPSVETGPQPKNTPLGRSVTDDGAIYR